MTEICSWGGDWTSDKLERLRKYLHEYTKIMNKQPFQYFYVDAFAGTGYRALKKEENFEKGYLLDFDLEDAHEFLDGSVRIALQIKPQFKRYIFIEKDINRYHELEKIKDVFPHLKERINIENSEANRYLQDFCGKTNWYKTRAVLFLDPYGMEVSWDTIKSIANTKSIDVWILFPLGVAVNRLLRKDGNIDKVWRNKLDIFFGTSDWYDAFYRCEEEDTLFGVESRTKKVANFPAIEKYFINRLKSLFPSVAENPLVLYNSKKNPLYLLCFAASNEKGAQIAKRIAQHILGK